MCLVIGAIGLPNSSRTAATITLIGFQAATHCRALGSDSIGTKAVLRNVSGNTITKPTPMTASGERTVRPIHVPTQIIADENRISSTSAASTCSGPVCVRQPTSSPAPSSTTIDRIMPASSAR